MGLGSGGNSRCERMRRFEAEKEFPAALEKAPLNLRKSLHVRDLISRAAESPNCEPLRSF